MAKASDMYEPELEAAVGLVRANADGMAEANHPRDCIGFAALIVGVENLYREAATKAKEAGIQIPTLDEEVWSDIAQEAAILIGDRLDKAAAKRSIARN